MCAERCQLRGADGCSSRNEVRRTRKSECGARDDTFVLKRRGVTESRSTPLADGYSGELIRDVLRIPVGDEEVRLGLFLVKPI